jgi:hypothetical protein
MSLDESLKLANLVLGLVNFLIGIGLGVYVRNSNRHEKIDQRFAQLEANVDSRLDSNSDRLARLEERASRAPTHEDLGKIYERINAIAASQAESKGALDSINATMRQLVSRLIEKGIP